MRLIHRLRAQDGFTMIIALGVMFVTGLILVAAFTVANGDVHSSHRSTLEKQAYYAALAGIQQYEATLQSEPNYWQTCKTLKSRVPEGKTAAEEKLLEEEERGERYVVKPVPATGQSACSTELPFTSMIESKGAVANTFRIRSTGTAGRQGSKSESAERSVIASFGVSGFLQYVYYTNFETIDPALYEKNEETLANECRGKYYKEWSKTNKNCEKKVINWVSGDHTEGPMHTNDSALVSGGATFGREKAEPKDQVEINGGTYGSSAGCASTAKYYTTTKCYNEKGPTLTPPPSDESLEFYVEESNRLKGVSKLVLKGNEIVDTYFTLSAGKYTEAKKTIPWPTNGLIYVENNGTCSYEYEYENADTSTEVEKEKGCANVYVEGVYEKSLTIASYDDVIINGSVYPSSVSGKLASSGSEATKPSGTPVLGLIANNFVRVYHPCVSTSNEQGIKDPWIYAGILATQHSFVVDNPGCGNQLGKLNIYGAIGQNYRGVVGTSGSPGTGYLKHYEYDGRLATDEPPYFLAPLKAGWKVVRETAQGPG